MACIYQNALKSPLFTGLIVISLHLQGRLTTPSLPWTNKFVDWLAEIRGATLRLKWSLSARLRAWSYSSGPLNMYRTLALYILCDFTSSAS